MNGKWHFIALASLSSILTVILDQYIYIFIYLLWITYLYMKKRISIFVIFFSIMSFLFFYFYIPSPQFIEKQIEKLPDDIASLSGKVKQLPKLTDKKFEFILYDEQLQMNFIVVYFFDQEEIIDDSSFRHIKYGSKCSVIGENKPPSRASNPFQFDYYSYLTKQGIASQFIINEPHTINCNNHTSLFTIVNDLRTSYLSFAQRKFHPEVFSWQQALILGDRTDIDGETLVLFQRWGLSHLLAISGLHVGIVSALVYAIFVRFHVLTKEKAQWFIIFFLPLFALIAGGQPSVWRASLMGAFVLLLHKMNVRMNHVDILSIVFILLLVTDKYMIYHVGFQFSFLVTFGLLLSLQWIKNATSNLERLFQINFVSQMVIVPIQMLYFYHFNPLSIVMNFLIVPYFSIIVIPFMFINVIISIFPINIIAFVQENFIRVHAFILKIIEFIDQKFNFSFYSGEITLISIIVYYFLFVSMMICLEKGMKKYAFYYGIALSILLTMVVSKPYASNEGRVTMLDIGQGDAFIIELPYRKGVFMIDAGAIIPFSERGLNDRVYKQVIKPYLMGRGINKIDTIFITHQDSDHDGSVPFVVNDFAVDEIIVHHYYDTEQLLSNLNKSVNVTTLSCGENVKRSNFHVYVLSPCEDKQDENENSLVLFTQLGGLNWLFTGDIGERTEKELMERFEHLNIDVLKVAHHGSKTSSKAFFLHFIKPNYALISVGRNNRYGHPAEETIVGLEEVQATIFRTDLLGAVQYRYRKEDGTFEYFINDDRKSKKAGISKRLQP